MVASTNANNPSEKEILCAYQKVNLRANQHIPSRDLKRCTPSIRGAAGR
jgi:hypothetical protein